MHGIVPPPTYHSPWRDVDRVVVHHLHDDPAHSWRSRGANAWTGSKSHGSCCASPRTRSRPPNVDSILLLGRNCPAGGFRTVSPARPAGFRARAGALSAHALVRRIRLGRRADLLFDDGHLG